MPPADFDGPGDLGSSFAMGDVDEEPVEAADCAFLPHRRRTSCYLCTGVLSAMLPSCTRIAKQIVSPMPISAHQSLLSRRARPQSTNTRDDVAADAAAGAAGAAGPAGLGEVGTSDRHAPRRVPVTTRDQSDRGSGTAS